MTVDERDRLALHQRLEATLGAGPAETMMQLLPPMGGTDLATRTDLVALGARMDASFTTIDQRFVGIDQRLDSIDLRFVGIDQRLDSIDQRLDSMNERFEGRFEGLEHRFIGLEHRFEGLNDRIEGSQGMLRGELKEGLAGVRTEIAAQTRTIMFVLLATVISFGGLVLAAVRLG